MKRLLIILCTVAVAAPLAILTMSKTAKRPFEADGDTVTIESEAGNVIVRKSQDIRAKYASMVASARENSPELWLRDFELTERSGERLNSQQLRGSPYIASFFFSTCPSICVLQNDQVRLLQEKFRNKPIKFVSISVDPKVDTPEVLSAYADRVGAIRDKWFFLTGDFSYIQRVSTEVFFHPLPQLRFHQEKFFLVDAKGALVGGYEWNDKEQLKQLEVHALDVMRED